MWASHELLCLPTRCLFCLFCVPSAWEGHPDIRVQHSGPAACGGTCSLWPDLSGHISLTSCRCNGPRTAFPTPPATNGCITTTVSFTMTNVLDVVVLRVCVCFHVSEQKWETGVMSSVHQKTKTTKKKPHDCYKKKLRSKFLLLTFPLLLSSLPAWLQTKNSPEN